MNNDERMAWEAHKDRRAKSRPMSPDMGRTCYEVFDSFDEFTMNGSPYHLNGCGGLPPQPPQSVQAVSGGVPMVEYTEPSGGDENVEVVGGTEISPQVEAALWSQATGIPFTPYFGTIGEQQLRILRDMNQGYRW